MSANKETNVMHGQLINLFFSSLLCQGNPFSLSYSHAMQKIKFLILEIIANPELTEELKTISWKQLQIQIS